MSRLPLPNRMTASRWGAGFAVLAALGSLASCAPRAGAWSSSHATPRVVTTTGIWADIVRAVACDNSAQVRSLVPDGADPHAFEPSLADRALLESADLVVANGLDLEGGVSDLLEQLDTHLVRTGDVVDPDGVNEHGHDGLDPHIWLDPTLVSRAVTEVIAPALVRVGADGATVRACARSYVSRLAVLDDRAREQFAQIPARDVVTGHQAFAYLLARYGLRSVASLNPSTADSGAASARAHRGVEDVLRSGLTSVVLVEYGEESQEAASLRADVAGVHVAELFGESLGPAGSGADTYLGLIQTDVELLVRALSSTSTAEVRSK